MMLMSCALVSHKTEMSVVRFSARVLLTKQVRLADTHVHTFEMSMA